MRFIALSLVLILGGCAGHHTGLNSADIRTHDAGQMASMVFVPDQMGYNAPITASAERVWAALPEAFASLGISAGVIEEGHMFGNRSVRIHRRLGGERLSRYVNCGRVPEGGPAADVYLVELDVIARPEAGRTDVTNVLFTVQGQATAPAGSTRTACTSTGVLEDRLARTLQGLLDQ